MGIQDRDYWREWHNEREKGQKPDPRYDPKLFRRDRSGDNGPPDVVGANWPWQYQLAFFALLVLAILLIYALLYRAPVIPPHQPVVAVPSSLPRSSVIDANRAEAARRHLEVLANQERERQLEKIAADARRKRDAQWQAFYKPSSFCKDNPATVDCANEFIRARRAFDARYEQ